MSPPPAIVAPHIVGLEMKLQTFPFRLYAQCSRPRQNVTNPFRG